MTPHNQLVAYLLLVAEAAEAKAQGIRAIPGKPPFGTAEDHSAEVMGNLLDAIDRVQPGLGTRLHLAMNLLSSGEVVHS